MIKRDEQEFAWRILGAADPIEAAERMELHPGRRDYILQKWADLDIWEYGIHPSRGWFKGRDCQGELVLKERMTSETLELESNLFAYSHNEEHWMLAGSTTPMEAALCSGADEGVWVSRARPMEPEEFVPGNAGDSVAEMIGETAYELIGEFLDFYDQSDIFQAKIEEAAREIIDADYFWCVGPRMYFRRTGEDSYERVE